ncbi:MAG: ABC transporter substrate-binding protein [Gammaproteobacteria bacterium]|nr:ABC transporter substrate-binding protein [Gammaproteobacteria bacterium]
MHNNLLNEIAPTGVLRAAINMSNFLLVTGETETGEPDGVSPDIAREIAKLLGVECKLIPFAGPGELADAVDDNVWDIGNIAAEPERARTITFSPAYCEIQATYLLPADSPIQNIHEVDSTGNRIAVKERSAYDLWLTDNIRHATLVKAASIDDSFQLFVRDKLEALAGLRPKLLEQQKMLSGARVLNDSFTAVRQSIGCRPGRNAAAVFLKEFVEQSITNGLIKSLINKHGVQGQLSVAPFLSDSSN